MKYTEQQLVSMPLTILRNLDLQSKEEERLVQKVVEQRLQKMPPSTPVYRNDVPDISSPEEEKVWQEKINERMAKLNPSIKPLEALNPEADNFDPTTVEVAQKESEGTPIILSKKSALQKRIDEAERIQEGTPVTLGGGVSTALRGRPRN